MPLFYADLVPGSGTYLYQETLYLCESCKRRLRRTAPSGPPVVVQCCLGCSVIEFMDSYIETTFRIETTVTFKPVLHLRSGNYQAFMETVWWYILLGAFVYRNGPECTELPEWTTGMDFYM